MALNILIVDDYPLNCEILTEMLTDMGCTVTDANDGKLALDLITGGARFDIVLMDVAMPTMNGIEATTAIRKLPGYATTPIIGISACSDSYQNKCIEAGMNDIMGKPFTEQALRSVITRWTGDKMTPDQQPIEPAAVQSAGNQVPDATADRQVFNYDKVVHEFQGNKQLAAHLIGGFLNKLKQQSETIRCAIRGADGETVCREAHTIKGGALNLCAANLAEAAKQLESAAAAREMNGIEVAFTELKSAIETFTQHAQVFTP
jgi:two-component system sensor histidine kinase/response regulator